MERGLAALWLGIGLLLLLLVNFAAGSAEEILHTNVHHDSQESGAVHRKELDLERSAHLKEIEDLKHKLSALEIRLQDQVTLLKLKDTKIISLESNLHELQKTGGKNVEAKLEAALARVKELEAEIQDKDSYSKELEQTVEALQSRADAAESANEGLLSRIEKADKSLAEQKKKLLGADRALRIAEAAMRKAEADVAAKAQELLKVYEGWLPPWAATKVAQLQASSTSKWLEHGEPHYRSLKAKIAKKGAAIHKWSKPYLSSTLKGLNENVLAFQSWAQPHVSAFQEKWNPVVKHRFGWISEALSHQLENLQKQGQKGLECGQQYLLPHFERAKQFVDPYVQVVLEKAKPHVDTVGAALGPHYARARSAAQPHFEKLGGVFRDVLSSATAYHQQLQASVKGTMSKHELLSSLASREVVWFLASLVVALPVVGAFVVFSSAVSTAFGAKKPAKPVRGSHKKSRRVKQVDK